MRHIVYDSVCPPVLSPLSCVLLEFADISVIYDLSVVRLQGIEVKIVKSSLQISLKGR